MKKRIYENLFVVFSLIILFGIVLFGYWYFLEPIVRPVWNVKVQIIKTEFLTYNQGDEIFANSPESCKLRDLIATRQIYLVNDYKIELTAGPRNMGLGCRIKLAEFAKIPDFAPAGLYHLEGKFSYQINPIKILDVPFVTNEFQVIK